MKKILVMIISLFFCDIAVAQLQWSCDTDANLSQNVKTMAKQFQKGSLLQTPTNANIPVYLHIVRRDDGSGGFSINEVNNALSVAQNNLAEIGITLTNLGIDIILDDYLYDYNPDKFGALEVTNALGYAIDINFRTIPFSGTLLK